MKTLFTLFTALILPLAGTSNARAQVAIKGKVLDEGENSIPYTTVVLLNPTDSAVVQGKITNEQGEFLFEQISSGDYLLSISFVGYETFYKELMGIKSDINLGSVTLTEASHTLDGVTVNAQRSLVEKKPDRLIVNLDNSILTKGAMADEVLKVAPLVSTDMDGNIKLRGKPNVMVLIDGKNIPSTTLNTVLENLSGEEIAKIEVITNPSAKYDAAASGGVINIVTKKGLQQGVTGHASIISSQGLRNRTNGSVTLNYRIERLQLSGNLNYAHGGNYLKESIQRNLLSIDNITRNHSKNDIVYRSPFGKVGIDYAIHARHQVGGAIEANYTDVDIVMEATTNFFSQFSQPDSTLLSQSDWISNSSMYNFNINYSGKLGNKGEELSMNTTHTIFRQDSRQTLFYRQLFSEDFPDENQRGIRTATPSDISITIAQLDYTHPFNENFTTEIGVKYTGTTTDNQLSQGQLADDLWTATLRSSIGYKEAIYAGYLSVNTTLGSVNLQAGLRAEQTDALIQDTISRNFVNLFPSILLAKGVNEHYSLSLSYSRKIDRPVYRNLIPFQIFLDPYSGRTGNPLLLPQYSDVIELTNTYKDVTFLASYTNTQNAMLDIPFQNEETLFTTYTYQNLASVASYSLSFILPFQVSRWWQTNSTVTGMYNTFRDPSINDIPFDQDIFGFTINSTNTFLFANDWKAELVGYYNSASQYGISRVEPMYALQAGVSKDIWQGRGNVKLAFDDIF